jgi:hypothetical protein
MLALLLAALSRFQDKKHARTSIGLHAFRPVLSACIVNPIAVNVAMRKSTSRSFRYRQSLQK